MLHQTRKPSPKTDDEQTSSVANVASSMVVSSINGILPVVKIKLTNGQNSVETYALCDSGSSVSFMDEQIQKQLNVLGFKTQLSVVGFNGSKKCNSEIVEVDVSNTLTTENFSNVKFYVHDAVYVGSEPINVNEIKRRFPHVNVLPDGNYSLKDVKVILGQECYDLHRPIEYRKPEKSNAPWAIRTKLGWTLSGPLPQKEAKQLAVTAALATVEDQLSEQVKKWWDIESYASNCNVSGRSKDDQRAQSILQETVRYNGQRYEVGLLWKHDNVTLPNNFTSALGQLKSLENRFNRDPELKKRYQATIDVDLENGYVRKLSNNELSSTRNEMQWYIPHHPVLNPHKPEKVRRVCNAAAKYQGVSLNDMLLTGPDLLQSLIGIIFRFREHEIALSADIEAMFMQVEALPADAKCLRFLWKGENQNVEVYEYTRHIFGAKSSPTCANYALHQTARDNESEDSAIRKLIFRNFYMDDFLKSVKTAEEAQFIYDNLKCTMLKGGFKLTKWVSNDEKVNDHFPEEDRSTKAVKTFEAEPMSSSILGLNWNVDKDILEVCRGADKPVPNKITQRVVLSAVSAVFDPLGICSPFTIRMRLLLKKIWAAKGQAWDEPLSDEFRKPFLEWCQELQLIRTMNVQRLYLKPEPKQLNLHLFTDASEDAMCIVAYLQDADSLQLSYIVGKCRVAPIRHMTIPKLELQAAVYGVRLRDLIIDQHDVNFDKFYHWTDSSTVLQWLQGAHKKQPVFVANRVAEILESSTADEWYHVKGIENPADIGTRGMTVELLKESQWLNGPAWLKQNPEKWPKPFNTHQTSEENPDEEVALAAKVETEQTNEPKLVKNEQTSEGFIDFTKYSSFNRIRNVVAYCMRIFSPRKQLNLQVDELEKAEKFLYREAQKQSFPELSKSLLTGKPTAAKFNFPKLSPLLEANGLIRLKGRLKYANISYNAKHPILLTAKHPLVKLKLEQTHRDNLHEGTEHVRNLLQQEFWIIGIRNALRQIKASCVKCRHRNAQPLYPPMADLPKERLSDQVYPFTNTGVDYFGPFEVKHLRKTEKRWCCLFTCLTTRAVHIEVVQSLDTESCLAALTRFTARRGKPVSILSDNGTNFVGAANELKSFMDGWNKDKIVDEMALSKITWKFNPPGAPHFGGVWERLVRSCKKVMLAVLDGRGLTDEILGTTMCLVEQTLNARPLTAVSDDPEDLNALTPNHFLLGRDSVCAPFLPNSERYHDLRRAFKTSQCYSEMIWKRWMKEYLPQWNSRSKWKSEEVRNLQNGELVWLVDESLKRSEYKMGRVKEIYYGSDGVARSALVKFNNGDLKRPVVKLAPVFHDSVFTSENGAGDVGARDITNIKADDTKPVQKL